MSTSLPQPITPAEISAAQKAIDPIFLATPALSQTPLDAALDCVLWLKVETLNPIRSFKGRGTEALFAGLKDMPKAVVATSTGNPGQGLGRAAARRGVGATILAPSGSNPRSSRRCAGWAPKSAWSLPAMAMARIWPQPSLAKPAPC